MNAPLFIHSPIEGHSGYFKISSFTNKDSMNVLIQVFMWT